MSIQPILRVSVDPSQHALVDAELKSLKLISRRLQKALTFHAAELRILRRLYYKNKNQHRGSLFWRNVIEMRRYFECVERSSLLDSLNAMRFAFYGPASPSANLMKGSWTHFPDTKSLSNSLERFQVAAKLMEKTSEVCLKAFQSFHRSLQSAAFLQLLLVFVAISSRMRTVTLELQEVIHQAIFSIIRLSIIHRIQTSGDRIEMASVPELGDPDAPSIMNTQNAPSEHSPSKSSHPDDFLHRKDSSNPRAIPMVIVEHKNLNNQKHTTEEKQALDSTPYLKKKRRKAPKNEIDDIFGF